MTDRFLGRFEKRRKGQHRDKRLFEHFCFQEGPSDAMELLYDKEGKSYSSKIGTIEIVSITDGKTMSGSTCQHDNIVVHLNDGTMVPAYRIHSSTEKYNICQDFGYKAKHKATKKRATT